MSVCIIYHCMCVKFYKMLVCMNEKTIAKPYSFFDQDKVLCVSIGIRICINLQHLLKSVILYPSTSTINPITLHFVVNRLANPAVIYFQLSKSQLKTVYFPSFRADSNARKSSYGFNKGNKM